MAALTAILSLALLAVAIGGVTGVLRLDLTGFSGLHQVYAAGPDGEVVLEAPDPWSMGLSGRPGWVVMAALLAALTMVSTRKRVAA